MGRSPNSATAPSAARSTRNTFLAIRAILLVAFGALLASCDANSDPFSVSSLHEDGWRLVVEPADIAMDLGSSMALSAYLQNEEGRRRTLSSVGLEVEWISERPSVARVDESGRVFGDSPGDAEVDAHVRTREADLSADASVRVNVPPSRVRVENDASLTGTAGAPLPDEVRVTVLGPNDLPAAGVRVYFDVESGQGAVSPSAVWTDEDGSAHTSWVLGPTAGEQTLHVSAQSGTVVGSGERQGAEAEAEVVATAAPAEPARIVVTPTYLSMVPDSSAALEAEVLDGFGNPIPEAPTAWGITKPWVASVTSSGAVEALHEGVALITVSSDTIETRATVVVSEPDVSLDLEKVDGDAQTGTVDTALDVPLRVRVTESDGSGAGDIEVVWNVTEGGGWTNATTTNTDADGYAEVTWTLGTRAGVQGLTASASGVGTVTFDAFAEPGEPNEIVISPSTLTLTTDEGGQLSAEVRDDFGNLVPNTPVSWTSMDPGIASISSSGYVTAQNVGNATVGASSGQLEGWSLVKVEAGAPPTGGGGTGGGTGGGGGGGGSDGGDTTDDFTVAAAGGDAQTGTVGEPLDNALRVQVTGADGSGVSGETVTWSVASGGGSLSASSTTTDGSGYAQVNWTLGTTAGTQAASATVSGAGSVGFSATAEPGSVSNVEVSPASLSLEIGTVAQLEATATDQHGNTVTDASAQWASSDTTIATVSAEGAVEAVAEGSATVTATAEGVAVDVPVEVLGSDGTADAPDAVQDLQVVATSDSSVTLQWTQVDDGTGSPADYAIRYGSPTITWWDAYETEVSVTGDAIGETIQHEYTGLAAGTEHEFRLVPYRGTLDVDAEFGPLSNAASGTTTAESDPAVASVTVSPTSLTLEGVGATGALESTAYDGADEIVSDVSIEWSSSDPAIATVSSEGTVTAEGIGTALVIATAVCCNVADSATVTVNEEDASSTDLWPNEPSGFSLLSDRPVSVLDEGGWSDIGSVKLTVEEDSTGPESPSGVLQFLYPEGEGGPNKTVFGGSSNHGIPAGSKEVYFGFWMKLSDNWQEHSTPDSPKLVFLGDSETGGGGDPLVVNRNPDGQIGAFIQNGGLPPNRFDFNRLNHVSVEPGQWARVEFVAVMNSTKTSVDDAPAAGTSTADGELHVWVNGTKIYEVNDIWYSEDENPDWDSLRLQPLWGGQNDVLSETINLRVDHVRLKAR